MPRPPPNWCAPRARWPRSSGRSAQAAHAAPRRRADFAAATPESAALTRELKRRGFRFVGPTTVYALMQAAGLVNDHVAGCCVRAEVEREQLAAARAPGSLSLQ